MLSRSPFRKSTFAVLLLGVSAILISGCENTASLSASSRPNSEGAVSEPSFAQFSDVPVPTGAKMDLQRSLVLGERDAWIGSEVSTKGQGRE